jgi:hypothetical protein
MEMRLQLRRLARLLAGLGVVVGAAILVVVILALLEQATPHHSVAEARTRPACADEDGDVDRGSYYLPASAAGDEANATICSLQPIRAIPSSYLGVSTEYWTMPLWEAHGAIAARVLSLLRVPGDGRLVLRIGGDSSQRTFWVKSTRGAPSWTYLLTPRWFAQTRQLVDRTGARVILDLNTITGTPSDAEGLVRAAESRLPRGSIIGFEIGNESDLYLRSYWLDTIDHPWADAAVAPPAITASDYARQFVGYSAAVRSAAAGVPLLGPTIGNSLYSERWIRTLLADPHPGLGTVSGHWYPYSGCAHPGRPSYPSIAKLMDGNVAANMARGMTPVIRLVHRMGLKFRLTELNSVTCGGLRGVSNTFATALWTPDALFRLLGAGVDGINIHVREDAVNQAFALRRFGLQAQPLLYGMLLFDRTMGPDAQLVRVHLDVHHVRHFDVYAVRVAHNVLHVLAIDKSGSAVRLDLVLPATAEASVQRLLAPSVSARYGVSLDGQWLGRDARWHGRASEERIKPGSYGYQLTVPRYSAALMTVQLSPVRKVIRPRAALPFAVHADRGRRRGDRARHRSGDRRRQLVGAAPAA